MIWTIPGTVLQAQREDAGYIQEQLGSMFLGGGISLGQVANVTGLETHNIQNWVKRGFLTPPVKKRYSLRQLCRILNINMLKGVLQMEQICELLGYVNGHLDDESDDIIDDTQLYFLFVRLAAQVQTLYAAENREKYLEQALANYQEPVPGAKNRVKQALRIMLTAWLAERMRQEAEKMIKNAKENAI